MVLHYVITDQDINTEGYVLYWFDISPPPNAVDLSEATRTFNSRKPLLQFTIVMKLHHYLLVIKGSCMFDSIVCRYSM